MSPLGLFLWGFRIAGQPGALAAACEIVGLMQGETYR